jgi:hypothetical protein
VQAPTVNPDSPIFVAGGALFGFQALYMLRGGDAEMQPAKFVSTLRENCYVVYKSAQRAILLMESDSNNGNRSQRSSKQITDTESPSPEEIVVSAQEYFSSEFPNPQRLDCPIEGTLSALVRARELPDDNLRAHLMGCSECLGEYRTAVRTRDRYPTHVAAVSSSSRMPIIFERLRVPIFAGTIALVLVSVLGIYFWGRRDDHRSALTPSSPVFPGSPSPSGQSSPAAPTLPALGASPIPNSPSPPRVSPSAQGELLAMNTVAVDLEEFSALRGGEGNSGSQLSIKLRVPRTRLNLKFPPGSPAGRYSLTVVNGAGVTLAEATATSLNGTDLSAVLNLQNIAPGSYRLRLTRAGEVPGYYPVTIKE